MHKLHHHLTNKYPLYNRWYRKVATLLRDRHQHKHTHWYYFVFVFLISASVISGAWGQTVREQDSLVNQIVSIGVARAQSSNCTLYVSVKTGSDSSSGKSLDSAFKTIQAAADNVVAGETVCVEDGIYTGGQFIVSLDRGGTQDEWITFRSINKWGAVIDGRNNSSSYCWNLTGNANYIKIEGFELTGCSNGFWSNSGNSHDVIIKGNRLHHLGRQCANTANGQGLAVFQGKGMRDYTYDSNLVHDNGRFHGCSENDWHDQAFYLMGDNVTVVNNVFYNNSSGWDIVLSGYDDNDNWLISNNVFAGADEPFQRFINGRINIEGESTNITIQNNIFYDPPNSAVQYYPNTSRMSNIVIRNNLTNTDIYNVFDSSSLTPSVVTFSSNYENTDPGFVSQDPNSSDFLRITDSSSAYNAGTSQNAPTYDIQGNLRDSKPDIGAYEFGATGSPQDDGRSDTDNNCSITVAKDGSGDYTTIQAAADVVIPGDVVCIKPGTYIDNGNDNFVVDLKKGGNSQGWVIFRGTRGLNNEWLTKIDGENNKTKYCWNFGLGVNYAQVEDLEVTGCEISGFWSNARGHHITLKGNNIHDNGRKQWPCPNGEFIQGGRTGVYAGSNTSYHTYENNLIHDNGRIPSGCSKFDYNHDHGIYSRSISNVRIVNNIFYNHEAGWQIAFANPNTGNESYRDVLIANNTMYGTNPGRTGNAILVNDSPGAKPTLGRTRTNTLQ